MSGSLKHNLCPQIQSEPSGEDRLTNHKSGILHKNCERSIKCFENKKRKQMTSEDEKNIYQVFHAFKIRHSVMLNNRHIARCHVTNIYKKCIKQIILLSWCLKFSVWYLIYTVWKEDMQVAEKYISSIIRSRNK